MPTFVKENYNLQRSLIPLFTFLRARNISAKIMGTGVTYFPLTPSKSTQATEHMHVLILPCSHENTKVPSKATTNVMGRLVCQ